MYKENNRGRSWRRRQNKRIEKKSFNKFKALDWFDLTSETKDERKIALVNKAKKEKNHLKMCSCYICGNPRKWWNEITLQEKKANDIANSQDY